MATNVLYRHYALDGELLYVGITNDPGNRWRGHRRATEWWAEVARTSYEHFSSRAALEAAEKAAIVAERPRHNIAHNLSRRNEEGFRYLGWSEPPTEYAWQEIVEAFAVSEPWDPDVTTGLGLFTEHVEVSPEALAWCQGHPRTAYTYQISRSPVLTDSGFLSWLKKRQLREDGISDLVKDLRHDSLRLHHKHWSAQRLWVFLEDNDACPAVLDCVRRAVTEYEQVAA